MRTISDRAGLTIALVLTLAVWGAGMAVIIWGAQPLALQTAVESCACFSCTPKMLRAGFGRGRLRKGRLPSGELAVGAVEFGGKDRPFLRDIRKRRC
jgi:hypothetical protein